MAYYFKKNTSDKISSKKHTIRIDSEVGLQQEFLFLFLFSSTGRPERIASISYNLKQNYFQKFMKQIDFDDILHFIKLII